MNVQADRTLRNDGKKLRDRLAVRGPAPQAPALMGGNIKYELGMRVRAIACGGVGAFLMLAQRIGLTTAIDERLRLFKRRTTYFESDHVMALALSTLAGGTCLDDVDNLREDDAFLDAVGAQRIPDPTTLGDFTRRFKSEDQVVELLEAINSVRPAQWQRGLSRAQREVAYVDIDSSIVETTGECKEGMGLSYTGIWGYHPLIVSLANTREVLYLVNRPGNKTSDDDADRWADRAIDLLRPVFKRVCLRGDTAYYRMSARFDDWHDDDVLFNIGMVIHATLRQRFEAIPETEWRKLERPKQPVDPATKQRTRPKNVKQEIVHQRKHKKLRLAHEHITEVEYSPSSCTKTYRVVVLRKNISVERGENRLFDEIRYHAYITNDRELSAADVVFHNNARCEQENLIEQLKNGLKAMRMPVGDLNSNWAHMVIVSLAWSLKAWFALHAPRPQRMRLIKMEFRGFITRHVLFACQIVTTGRRLVYRILTRRESLRTFLRIFERIQRLPKPRATFC